MARPSKYKPEYAEQSQKLCELGATDREIASFFKVTERTLNRWKAEFPEFCQSLKVGKDIADSRVERSLFNRAVGYSFDSEKIFNDKDRGITRTPCVEHVAPDVTACIFWLKNRKQGEWRDKTDIDLNIKPKDVSANPLTPEAWDEQYSAEQRTN